ncbi:MAG: hypothetical protein ACRD5L_03155, partial [Bryobacteraceae bacterium]
MPDHAIPGLTPRNQPVGPLAAPGDYNVTLSVNGQKYSQPIKVLPDPRVHIAQADFDEQLAWAQKAVNGLAVSFDAFHQIASLRHEIDGRMKELASAQGAESLIAGLRSLDAQSGNLADGTRQSPGVGTANRDLARYFAMIESGDMRPSESAKKAVQDSCTQLGRNLTSWRDWNGNLLAGLNSQLAARSLAALPAAPNIPVDSPCGK